MTRRAWLVYKNGVTKDICLLTADKIGVVEFARRIDQFIEATDKLEDEYIARIQQRDREISRLMDELARERMK